MGKSEAQYEAEIRKLKARIAALERGTRRRLEIETSVRRVGGVTRIVTVQKHKVDPTLDEKTVLSAESKEVLSKRQKQDGTYSELSTENSELKEDAEAIEIDFPEPSKVLSFAEALERAAARGDFSAEVMDQLKEIGDREALAQGKAVYEQGLGEWQRSVPLLGSGEKK